MKKPLCYIFLLSLLGCSSVTGTVKSLSPLIAIPPNCGYSYVEAREYCKPGAYSVELDTPQGPKHCTVGYLGGWNLKPGDTLTCLE